MNSKERMMSLALALLAVTACGQPPGPSSTPTEGKVNAASTEGVSTSDVPTGQANAEDPTTGTNSGRPDSPQDLKPGTDGNTVPAAQ